MKRNRLIKGITIMTAAALLAGSGMAIYTNASEAPEETAAQTSAVSTEPLKQGDKSDAVAQLQNMLITLGFLQDTADGSFGPKTAGAVQAFQQAYGLEANGVADEEMLQILQDATDILPTEGQPEGEPADVMEFRTIQILTYDDGTVYVAPDTVSNKTLGDIQQILSAMTDAYNNSDAVPQEDTKAALSVDTASLPEGSTIGETILLEDLSAQAYEAKETIELDDTMGNHITVSADGNIASDTGNIAVFMINAETGETLGEAESVAIDGLAWKKPGELWIGNTKIAVDENGNYVVDANTVSAKSLQTVRNLFSAVDYGYITSGQIPADEIEVSIDNLPEGLTEDKLQYNASTNSYYVRQDVVAKVAEENGKAIEVQDVNGNTISADGAGNMSAPSNTDAGTAWTPTQIPASTAPQSDNAAQAPAPAAQASSTPAPAPQTPTPAAASNPEPAPAPTPAPASTPEPATTPAPHSHNYAVTSSVPATCTAAGSVTYTCADCGDSYTETVPATGHTTVMKDHYYLPHYLPPQYVCNVCGACFQDEQSIGEHCAFECGGGYHVDFYMLDYEEDLGMNYVDGCYGRGVYVVCTQCGAIVDQW